MSTQQELLEGVDLLGRLYFGIELFCADCGVDLPMSTNERASAHGASFTRTLNATGRRTGYSVEFRCVPCLATKAAVAGEYLMSTPEAERHLS